MRADTAIDRSILIVTEYYHNNLKPFFEFMSDDVLWLGPAEGQQMQGREQIIRAFEAEKHELTFTMGDISAICVSPHNQVKEVLLHFDIYTHYPSGSTDVHDQRMQFTWRERRIKTEAGQEMRAEFVMLHISNVWKYDSRDKIYPVHYETVPAPIRFLTRTEQYVMVRASDTSVRRIAAERIIYIETVKRSARLLIHTESGSFETNGKLPDFEQKLSGVLLRIHASYLVNPDHVQEIHRFFLVLSDGTKLPVPEKKYTQIKKQILENVPAAKQKSF